MDRLKEALESLDDVISELEDKVGLDATARKQELKNQIEMMKVSRNREANTLALAQKVASRLDDTIHHVESILRH